MTTTPELTADDFAGNDILHAVMIIVRHDLPEQVAAAIATLDADDQGLYNRVHESQLSYNDTVALVARERGELVQQVERAVNLVEQRLVAALVAQGDPAALIALASEIELATEAARKRTGSYVFTVVGACGDYYCEQEHLVGVFTSEDAAQSVASKPDEIKTAEGHTLFTQLEVVRVLMDSVISQGELRVSRSAGSSRTVRTVA